MVSATDSIDAWTEHAERRLHELALDLRRVPFTESTWRIHVCALGLKRAIARWRQQRPDAIARAALLDYMDLLAREVRRYRHLPVSVRPPTFASFRQAISDSLDHRPAARVTQSDGRTQTLDESQRGIVN